MDHAVSSLPCPLSEVCAVLRVFLGGMQYYAMHATDLCKILGAVVVDHVVVELSGSSGGYRRGVPLRFEEAVKTDTAAAGITRRRRIVASISGPTPAATAAPPRHDRPNVDRM